MPISWIFSQPLFFVSWVVAIVATLSIHEFCHAVTAYVYGDTTAKDSGRLTLNPFVHIDLVGFLMLLFVGFGWANPVPVNPYNLKKQKQGMIAVSLAGPFSNLLIAIIFGIIFMFLAPMLGANNMLTNFLFLFVLVNLSLFLFNLIPIPPLDGSKVLLTLLPDRFYDFKEKYSANGPWILLILVFADSFLNLGIFSWLFSGMLNLLSKLLG